MKNKLTLAAALALGSVAASAAITVIEIQNIPFSTTSDPSAPFVPGQTPALWVTGVWAPLNPADPSWQAWSSGAPAWSWELQGRVQQIAGVNIYVVGAEGTHNVPGPASTFGASIGLADIAGSAGTITSTLAHGGGDQWRLSANINPKGQLNFDLKATHVPEPGTYALIAGLGLVGFAAYRRMRA